MTADLADAERYQDAYASLVDQVDALVRRNALAEEEAQRISKFNAEILGHHNPAQRIMYVDRVRRELAECKQQLAELQVEQEREKANNAALQGELDTYKSVMVPHENKPKTHITRVARVPLTNMTGSLNGRASVMSSQAGRLKQSGL